MEIVLHGGGCCGIKTIHGFNMGPEGPKILQESKVESESPGVEHSRNCRVNYFTKSAPQETTEKRLKRYVSFLKRENAKGLIEVVLADHPTIPFYSQTPAWRPILEKLGFKEVTKFVNSNSGNTCFVFHLVTGQ